MRGWGIAMSGRTRASTSGARSSRRYYNAAVAALAAATLIAAPVIAAAQSCEALSQQRTDINVRMLQLIADQPGAHVVIGMCAASASSTYDERFLTENNLLSIHS